MRGRFDGGRAALAGLADKGELTVSTIEPVFLGRDLGNIHGLNEYVGIESLAHATSRTQPTSYGKRNELYAVTTAAPAAEMEPTVYGQLRCHDWAPGAEPGDANSAR